MILPSWGVPLPWISPAMVRGPLAPMKLSVMMPNKVKFPGLTAEPVPTAKLVAGGCRFASQTRAASPISPTAMSVSMKTALITYCVVWKRCMPLLPGLGQPVIVQPLQRGDEGIGTGYGCQHSRQPVAQSDKESPEIAKCFVCPEVE